MRKIVLCLAFLLAISNVVIPVNAQEIRTKVGEGYTSEGTYYSGTLSIYKFGYTSTQTVATYSGTIYEE